MITTIKNLGFLLKPRNIALIGAALAASSLPNLSFGNVQERVQKADAAMQKLNEPGLNFEQLANLCAVAEREYTEALFENPNDCGALAGFGDYKLKTGYPNKAIPHLEKAAEMCKDKRALELLISAYIEVKDYDSADKFADVLLQQNKNSAYAHGQKGFIHWVKGEYNEAIADCEKAVAIDPNLFRVFNCLAGAYEGLNDLENAKNCAEQAVIINPKYSNGHFMLGLLYKKMDKKKEAVAELKKAVELALEADNFREALISAEKMLK